MIRLRIPLGDCALAVSIAPTGRYDDRGTERYDVRAVLRAHGRMYRVESWIHPSPGWRGDSSSCRSEFGARLRELALCSLTSPGEDATDDARELARTWGDDIALVAADRYGEP